jgi:hypothetical protein
MELDDKQIQKLKHIPKAFQNFFKKAWNGNRPAAVHANCLECMGYSREEVHLCNTKTCPMWKLRPYRRDKIKPLAHVISRQDQRSELDPAPSTPCLKKMDPEG